MKDRGYIGLVALLLTGLAVALILGHGPWAGKELLSLSRTHGVNEGDLPVLVAWVLGLFCCVQLWRRR